MSTDIMLKTLLLFVYHFLHLMFHRLIFRREKKYVSPIVDVSSFKITPPPPPGISPPSPWTGWYLFYPDNGTLTDCSIYNMVMLIIQSAASFILPNERHDRLALTLF